VRLRSAALPREILTRDPRAVIALLKEHAEELRRKGVPVDAMIRDLERQIEVVRAAAGSTDVSLGWQSHRTGDHISE